MLEHKTQKGLLTLLWVSIFRCVSLQRPDTLVGSSNFHIYLICNLLTYCWKFLMHQSDYGATGKMASDCTTRMQM